MAHGCTASGGTTGGAFDFNNRNGLQREGWSEEKCRGAEGSALGSGAVEEPEEAAAPCAAASAWGGGGGGGGAGGGGAGGVGGGGGGGSSDCPVLSNACRAASRTTSSGTALGS